MTVSRFSTKRVLITVKTYPNSSLRYEETVCTAGITDASKWIRLYPLNFRRLPKDRQFKKYQWIDIDVESRKNTQDKRPESHRPDLDSVRLGRVVNTDDGWRERREILEPLPVRTLRECEEAYDQDRTSLSVVAPSEILDFTWSRNEEEKEWSDDFRREFEQTDLFGQKPLKLERLPFKFQYVFKCHDAPEPCRRMIEDWELGVYFFRMREDKSSETAALEAVRKRFLEEVCAQAREPLFFMGTKYPYNVWLILGVFWPPRQSQLELF